MQQAPQRGQTPKRRSVSRKTKIRIGFFVAILIVIIWFAGSKGWIPPFGSFSTTDVSTFASIVVTVFAAFFCLVPIIPADKVDSPEPVALPPAPTPVLPPINIHISPPSAPVDTSQTAATAKAIDYTHMQTELPATNKKVIQQREGVVKEVYAKLIGEGVSSVALVGIGGIGKSTLAGLVRDYAEEQRKLGKEPFKAEAAVFTVDGTTTFLDLASNIFSLLDKPLLDFSHFSLQSQAAALFHALNTVDQPRLIVLDQFENFLNEQGHALTASAGVGEFLDVLNSQPCTCRILLTSRPVPSGTHADLESCLHIYRVSGLTSEEGVALLRSQQIQGTDAELRQAVERCSGHAFALTLLVVMLKRDNLSLTTLLHDPAYLQLWEKDIAGRPKFLDYIYTHLLDDVSRQLLLAFAIYREPVPLEAVLPIVAKTKAELLPLMRSLLVQNLFHIASNEQFELHPLIASYALNHFVMNDEAANTKDRQTAHAQAAQYYVQLAAKHCPERTKRRSVKDVQPLIEAVWQHCQAAQWQEAYTLMIDENLFSSLSLWGANTLLLELCQLLLSENWQYQPLQMATIYSYTAGVYDILGQKQQALKYHEMDLRVTREAGDRGGEGTTLNNLGRVYDDLGDNGKALEYYKQALGIRREVGDRGGEGTTLNNLGRVYDDLGEKSKAVEYYEQALSISREVGDRGGEGTTLNNLGSVYDDLGEKSKALEYYEQALSILREVGNRGVEGTTLNNLGKVYDDLGEKDKAIEYYEQALGIRREVGDRGGEGATFNNLGSVYNALGEKGKAIEYYEQALSILREVGDRSGEGVTLHNIGMIYAAQSRNDVALACVLLAKKLFEYVESRSDVDDEVQWIANLRKRMDEGPFATLLARVESRAEHVVEEAMREVRDGMIH